MLDRSPAPEVLAAGAVVLAYAAMTLLCFPAYLRDVVPVVRDTYLPVRAPASSLWLAPPMLVEGAALATTLWLAGRKIAISRAAAPLLAAIGFAATVIVQGKGFLNHFYPGVALALLALALVIGEGRGTVGERRFASAAWLTLAAAALWLCAHVAHYPGLAALVARVGPPHPRILVVGGDLSVGHPLTRQVGGEWVGHPSGLPVTADVEFLLHTPPRPLTAADRAHLQALAERELRQFCDDVARRHADVVLVEGAPGLLWIRQHPAAAAALAGFRPAGEAAGIVVWVRRPAQISPASGLDGSA